MQNIDVNLTRKPRLTSFAYIIIVGMKKVNNHTSEHKKFLSFLTQDELDAVAIHLLFSLLCLVVLGIPLGLSRGLKISLLVLLYIIMIPFISRIRGYPE